jgi:tyrosine-protein kinase Etk/Wzc
MSAGGMQNRILGSVLMSRSVQYQQPGRLVEQQFVMPPHTGDEEPELSSYLTIFYEQKWLIAAITFLVLLAGSAYALLASPVYEANVLVHVEEENPKESKNFLTESGSMFNMKTSASAEIELFQSRLVISKAVDKLNLDISAEPDYLPVIGKWLSKYSEHIPQPGWIQAKGYAWGAEKIRIEEFRVPDEFLNREFSVIAVEGNRYRIVEPISKFASSGNVGEAMRFMLPSGPFELLISEIQASPDMRFILKRVSRQVLIDDMLKRMQVTEQGKQSGIIRATLQGKDPVMVNSILGEVATAYISQNSRRKTQEADAALTFLEKQLPEMKNQLNLSEARYSQFRNQNSTIDLGEEAKISLQQSSALKTRKIELDQRRIELLTRFMPEHPIVKGVDTQLAEVTAEMRKLAGHIKTLPQTEQELVRLSRDVKVNTELYTAVLNTARQLKLTTVAKTSNVRLIDMPLMPEIPVAPNRVRIVGISALAGLMLGILSAFIRNSLQKVINNPSEIEHIMGMPVYATIPHSKMQADLQANADPGSTQPPLLASALPMDVAIESLRTFRTVLQYTMSNLSGKIVLITGPTAGTGKSFVSANLAALIGSGGKRVLLIDGDLRNGHLHVSLGQTRHMGLSEVIIGTHRFPDVVFREVLPNVDFLSTGTLSGASSELLMRPVLPALLATLEEQYDVILIDSAPVLSVSDTVILGMHASAIYLLTQAGVTTADDVVESLKRLMQAGLSVNGVLLNGVHLRGKRYGYGYGYGAYWQTKYGTEPRVASGTLS